MVNYYVINLTSHLKIPTIVTSKISIKVHMFILITIEIGQIVTETMRYFTTLCMFTCEVATSTIVDPKFFSLQDNSTTVISNIVIGGCNCRQCVSQTGVFL